MHRFVLSGTGRSALRHTAVPQSLLARSISSSATLAAEASPAAAASPLHSIQQSAAAVLNANKGGRSSSASFVRFEQKRQTGPVQKGAKKVRQRAPHKNVAPLLTRIWGRNGNFKTLSPEDWSNIILNNRRRLLQLREKEQYRAWVRFQKLKSARLAWLRENNEEVSVEMRARIAKREKEIMDMTKEARAAIKAPVPPLPLKPKQDDPSDKSLAASTRAKHTPQLYLRTQYKSDVWRVFTFRLTHYHSHVLHRQQEKFRELAQRLGLAPSRPTYLPHRTKSFDIIRGPHVDKTSREQYETRLYSLKIRISPSVDKFYAVQRLCELTFRLINGNVKMRVETPPNLPIESVVFAPHPLKAENGHVPQQQFASRNSPGIENILYKFDQHQFPFLADWEEEILDDKFRGIYPPERDADKPYPLRREEEMGLRVEGLEGEEQAPSLDAARAAADVADGEEADEGVFDEQGEFGMEDAEFEEDEVTEEEMANIDSDIDDERDDIDRIQDRYEELVQPLVKRKRTWDK